MWCFLLLALFVTVQGRAVNISNTWVLPEEGFPVFYRYFRDRISWYEADAVCQFHHANLVTVDTTAQYDAVRAYLKELDISSAVWVGLIRSNPDGDFTWTDYRGLSGDGYWSAAPDTRSAPLCAAADPVADYRWEARACGGPSVASFICELPVPQWALGNEGCMIRALPALTVLYLPESAAVQLTADCGLAGVKRVQCTGNVKREELLKELACAVDDQIIPSLNVTSPVTSWQITTDSVFNNQDFVNEATSTEENITTEHEDDINQSSSIKVISTSFTIIPDNSNKVSLKPSAIDQNKIPSPKNIDIVNDNILQDNETPKLVHDDDLFTKEQNEREGNDKMLHHTKLHDELARLGNLDSIFSQPTDHFVPPLVMAKAKISDDLTALSIQEKLAQHLSEQQLKHDIQQEFTGTDNNLNNEFYRTESMYNSSTTSLPLINLIISTKAIENENIETHDIIPKKYKIKHIDTKQKIFKNIGRKYVNTNEPLETTSISSKLKDQNNDFTSTVRSMTERVYVDSTKSQMMEDASLELTVIIKEPSDNSSYEGNVDSTNNSLLINISRNPNNVETNGMETTETPAQIFQSSTKNYNLNEKETINIKMSINENIHSNISLKSLVYKDNSQNETANGTKDFMIEKSPSELSFIKSNETIPISIQSIAATVNTTIENATTYEPVTFQVIPDVTTNNTAVPDVEFNGNDTESKMYNISEIVEPSNVAIKEGFDSIADSEFDLETNITDSGIDFQSPLLSAASEPIPKPNRSRRIQQQPRNKFNPFRILG